jgi:hypothetical protein
MTVGDTTTTAAMATYAYDQIDQARTSFKTDEAIAYLHRSRGGRKQPTSGWASLTPAECDVVRLVSNCGKTSPQFTSVNCDCGQIVATVWPSGA